MSDRIEATKNRYASLATTFAHRAREAADHAKLRNMDVLRPVIDTIAEAPGVLFEVTAGAAQEAADEIQARAREVGRQVDRAGDALQEIARERELQVAAAKQQMAAGETEVRAKLASQVGTMFQQQVGWERTKHRLQTFALAGAAAFVLLGIGYAGGALATRASAMAEAQQAIAATPAAAQEIRLAAERATQAAKDMVATTAPLAAFRNLTPRQQVDLLDIVSLNGAPWAGETVPFPCLAAGPKGLANGPDGKPADTCLVAVPRGTRVAGGALNDWLRGVIYSGGIHDLKPWGDLTRYAHPMPPPPSVFR